MIKYTANQTHFFAPIYMVSRALSCDYVFLMGQAQFSNRGWQNDCKLSTKSESQPVHRLKMILLNKNRRRLCEILAEPTQWSTAKKTLAQFYKGADGYERHQAKVNVLLDSFTEGSTAATVGAAALGLIMDVCADAGMSIPRIRSDIQAVPERPENASAWLAEMGAFVKGLHPQEEIVYVCGGSAMETYLELDQFTSRGIQVMKQEYKMPAYWNNTGWTTDATLSFLDALFCSSSDSELLSIFLGVQDGKQN